MLATKRRKVASTVPTSKLDRLLHSVTKMLGLFLVSTLGNLHNGEWVLTAPHECVETSKNEFNDLL